MKNYIKLLLWKFIYNIDRVRYIIFKVKFNDNYAHKRTIKLLSLLGK